MKRAFLILFSAIISNSLLAQIAETDPKHQYHYKDHKVETDEYIVELSNLVGLANASKFKIKITNKTNDFLIFDGSECVFKFPSGDFSPKEKPKVIKPNDSESKVLNVSGGNFHEKSYTFVLDGISRVAASGDTIHAPEFQLPASVNSFTAGPYEVTLTDLTKETKITKAKFKATYKGNNLGLIDATKAGVLIPGGQVYASTSGKKSGLFGGGSGLLEKGDSEGITVTFEVPGKVVDMQFATMYILWRGTFMESKKTAVKGQTFQMEVDPGKTAAQNK